MSGARTFHVVTMQNWMVEELTAALEPADWTVVHHYGLDPLPPQVGMTAENVLWAPGAFAAAEIVRGNPPRLSAPGPGWLPRLTYPWLVDGVGVGGRVDLVSAAAAGEMPRDGFWKLAESKLDSFPAGWRTAHRLIADLDAARIPPGALLHINDTRLTFIGEWRAIVLGGRVTAFSCYLDTSGRDRGHPDFTEPARVVTATARRIAAVYAAQIEEQLPAGPAYVLDIGRTSGGWVVIEANPVWSSAWYECDLPAFAEAVAASQGDSVPDEFVWKPDAVLIARARCR